MEFGSVKENGQGALEYLLLIGGAVLVAAVVLSLMSELAEKGRGAAECRFIDSLCSAFEAGRCNSADPDGAGALTIGSCTWNPERMECRATLC